MTDRLLTLAQVCQAVGFGSTWVKDEVRAQRFPQRIHIGRAARWSEQEIQAWIDAQKDHRDREQHEREVRVTA